MNNIENFYAEIQTNNSGVFESAERRVTQFSQIFHTAIKVSSISFVLIPGMLQYKAVVTNSGTSKWREAPFHDL